MKCHLILLQTTNCNIQTWNLTFTSGSSMKCNFTLYINLKIKTLHFQLKQNTKFSYLAFKLNPGALLLGLQFFLLVFLNTLQEAVSALWVLNVLDAHINSLSQDLAPRSKSNNWSFKKQDLCIYKLYQWEACFNIDNLAKALMCQSRVHKDDCSSPYEWPHRTLDGPYGKVNVGHYTLKTLINMDKFKTHFLNAAGVRVCVCVYAFVN